MRLLWGELLVRYIHSVARCMIPVASRSFSRSTCVTYVFTGKVQLHVSRHDNKLIHWDMTIPLKYLQSTCTLWVRNRCHFYFYNSFGNCGPISTVLTPSHSDMNYKRRWNKTNHLAPYCCLANYRAKVL